jgi:hypothetical protein
MGHVVNGSLYMMEKDFDQAALEFKLATFMFKHNAEAWALLGHAFLEMGKPDGALFFLEQGGELNPNWPFLVFSLSKAYKQAGNKNLSKAYEYGLVVVSREKTSAKIMIGLGLALGLLPIVGGIVYYVDDKIDMFKSKAERVTYLENTIDDMRNEFKDMENHKLTVPTDIAGWTKEVASQLHKYNNIEFMDRYPASVIGDMVQSRDHSRPLAVVIFPKADYNNAFYHNELESLHNNGYQVVVVEAGDRANYLSMCDSIAREWGKASIVVLGGHGSQFSLNLGKYELNPRDNLPLLKLHSIVVEGGCIVLQSCSTGAGFNNLASTISKNLPGVWVIGPDQVSSIGVYAFKPGAPIQASNMNYGGLANPKLYYGGREVIERNEQ